VRAHCTLTLDSSALIVQQWQRSSCIENVICITTSAVLMFDDLSQFRR